MDSCSHCDKPINKVFPRVVCKKCGFSGCGRCAPSWRGAAICPSCHRGKALTEVPGD